MQSLIVFSLVFFLLLLSSCAKTRVAPDVGRPPLETPKVKRLPSVPGIPATQRPYAIEGKTYYPLPSSEGYAETGLASWYGGDFHGRKTSNGETYNMHEMTAAHKILPMQTLVLVKNLENSREIVVRVNDRGPFVKDRVIDLSLAAAQELGIARPGTARVQVTALGETVTVVQGDLKTERFLPHQDFTRGDFYVQIGSFLNPGNAERLRDRMLAAGMSTVIEQFERDFKVSHRVQVKAGETLQVAKNMEAKLNGAGFPDAFVVAR
jgi:rare lipoprotein A